MIDTATILNLLIILGVAAAGVAVIFVFASWLEGFLRGRKERKNVLTTEERDTPSIQVPAQAEQMAADIETKAEEEAGAEAAWTADEAEPKAPEAEAAWTAGEAEPKAPEAEAAWTADEAKPKAPEAEAARNAGEAEPKAPEVRAGDLSSGVKGVAAESLLRWGMPRGAEPVTTKEEMETLYAGEVEIVLDPSIDLAVTYGLHNHLLANPDIKIVRVVGSSRQGSTVAVSLTKSIPLIVLLEDSLPKGARFFRGKEGVARIGVSLNNSKEG